MPNANAYVYAYALDFLNIRIEKSKHVKIKMQYFKSKHNVLDILSNKKKVLYVIFLFFITRNYLFGGFSSLLGASELDRYIPKRSITIFIATWNMNGKVVKQL